MKKKRKGIAHQITYGVEIEGYAENFRVGSWHSRTHTLAAVNEAYPPAWSAGADSSLSSYEDTSFGLSNGCFCMRVGCSECYTPDGAPRGRENVQALEIVSPILIGTNGMEQIIRVVDLATKSPHWMQMNNTCGFHVHVGVETFHTGKDPDMTATIADALVAANHFEIGMMGAGGNPHRSRSSYSRSLKRHNFESVMERAKRIELLSGLLSERYRTLTPYPILSGRLPTLEWRLWPGTNSILDIALFTQLSLAVTELSTNKKFVRNVDPMGFPPVGRTPYRDATSYLLKCVGWFGENPLGWVMPEGSPITRKALVTRALSNAKIMDHMGLSREYAKKIFVDGGGMMPSGPDNPLAHRVSRAGDPAWMTHLLTASERASRDESRQRINEEIERLSGSFRATWAEGSREWVIER